MWPVRNVSHFNLLITCLTLWQRPKWPLFPLGTSQVYKSSTPQYSPPLFKNKLLFINLWTQNPLICSNISGIGNICWLGFRLSQNDTTTLLHADTNGKGCVLIASNIYPVVRAHEGNIENRLLWLSFQSHLVIEILFAIEYILHVFAHWSDVVLWSYCTNAM